MIKYVYLLWSRGEMPPARRREILLDTCGPALAAKAAGVQMNIVDEHATVPSPAPRPPFSEPFIAQVNLWLDDPDTRLPCEDVLRQAGFEIAGYRVDEWLYTEYGENAHAAPRDWPDGERSPGILAVTLLKRPRRIPRDEWMRRWFGAQSPMSEWMQPRARYVRNVAESAVTPGADSCDGIVEEDWPSGEHVTNRYLFYSARNRLELIRNMGIMLKTVSSMLNLWSITTVMMSEYFVKTPPQAGPGR